MRKSWKLVIGAWIAAFAGIFLMVFLAAKDWGELLHGVYLSQPTNPTNAETPSVSVIVEVKEFDPVRASSNDSVQLLLVAPQFCMKGKKGIPENRMTVQYGDTKFDIKPVSSPPWAFSGESQLNLLGTAARNIIWYPFDRYLISLPVPQVPTFVPSPKQALPGCAVSALGPVVNSALVSSYAPGVLIGASNPTDRSVVAFVIERPRLLRLMTCLLGLVTLIFLVFLATQRKGSELMVQSLAFFVTVWAARGVLLTNVTAFPVAIDYVTILAYFLAALILISKWLITG